MQVAGSTSKAKVIALLFGSDNDDTRSVAWYLASAYDKLLARGKSLSIVYIAFDAHDPVTAMHDHLAKDYFVALHRDEAPLANKLWGELQLAALPSLVLYDGFSGRLITKHGQRVLREDPECVRFPWKPQTLDELLGDVLILKDGKETDRREVLAGKHVGLLFVAQWSKPSLQMIEKLYVTCASIRQRRSGSFGHASAFCCSGTS